MDNQKKSDRNDFPKLIQIIPVPVRIDAVYDNRDGTELRSPVLFAGLNDDGDIEMFDFSPDGLFFDAKDSDNFLRLELVDEKKQ